MTRSSACPETVSTGVGLVRVAGLLCWHALALEDVIDDLQLAPRDRDARVTGHVDEIVLLAVELLGQAELGAPGGHGA